jgi:hypothetical protein
MRSIPVLLTLAVATALLPFSARAQDMPAVRQAGKKAAPKKDPTCQVQGVWQLESAKWGGTQEPMTGARERKMVTKDHFMFLSADAKRDTITTRTAADSLRAQQVIGGFGTYTVKGETYTEHLELFFTPSWEGRDVPAKCETAGDTWTHTWKYDTTTVTEVWRRISK